MIDRFSFRLLWVFVVAGGLSLVAEWGLLSSCGARASHCSGLSCCGTWALELRQLRFLGLAALRHVGYSHTRNQTPVPCIGRWILHHWATREAQRCIFKPDSHLLRLSRSLFLFPCSRPHCSSHCVPTVLGP